MLDFKAKMHQTRFWLGLHPRPSWGSLQHTPDPVAGLRGPTFKERGRKMGTGMGSARGKGRREGECITSAGG